MVGIDPNVDRHRATLVPSEGLLRVLHVVAPAEFGGLERVVHALSVQFTQHGHHVDVAVLLHDTGEAHPFVGIFEGTGIGVDVITVPARAYLREHRMLRRLIRERRPDVVHTHGYRCDIVGRRAAAAEGVPVVSTSHGFSRGPFRNRAYEWLQRREFRRFHAVAAVSASMALELRAAGVPAERIAVVPNALPVMAGFRDRIAARRMLGVPVEGFRVGWVGRFAWAKGLDVFVQALGSVDRAPWTASIIGAGAAESRARSIVADRGIEDRVTWHGQLQTAAQYLRAFDVLVISSRTEGTPMILLEAMAAGVPVVTTAVGGIPDVVDHRQALILPPESPRALAEAIEQVWLDPAAARSRAAAAGARLADYEPGAWARRYEDLYRRLAPV
jgi:glycosyltransferase involved in cell wall biosynthesis